MIEVGSMIPADALYIFSSLLLGDAIGVQRSYASLVVAMGLSSERSGVGSGAPESRNRLTIG